MKYELLNKQGITQFKKNQFVEAKHSFEKALELKSDLIEAIDNLGIVNHKLGNLDQAVKLYKRVVALDASYALESENRILSVIYFSDRTMLFQNSHRGREHMA